uniref:Putative secreted protein n=1 Tax=Ixodes ricinus TaxID=34613 RepID=A0A147BER0_IXORI
MAVSALYLVYITLRLAAARRRREGPMGGGVDSDVAMPWQRSNRSSAARLPRSYRRVSCRLLSLFPPDAFHNGAVPCNCATVSLFK